MNSSVQRLPALVGMHRDLWLAFSAAALFSIESWALGPLSWIYGYGSGLETIPAIKALSFDSRNFSLWAPFVAGGVDRLSFWGNANPFGPEYLLFSTLPVWLANGLHRFLQYFVAVYFSIRVADEQLGLKGGWAHLAGVMYGCFSYFTVGALFTLPGVPLMLWLLQRSVGDNASYSKAAGCGFLLSFATTFTFGVPYLLTFAALWIAIVQRPEWRKAIGPFAVFSVVLMIATAPQLLAIAVNAPASHRAAWIPESITASLDGLLYRQLQYDMFAQNHALSVITMNLPWLAFLAGLPLAWLGWRRGGTDKFLATKFLCVFAIFALLSQKWAWLLLQLAVSHFAPFARGIYMGRFFQIPAPFLIAAGLTLVVRLAWHFVPTRKIMALAVTGLAGFMLIVPKVHLFYPLGVDDWGQANYEVSALDNLRTQPELFRVASVLPLQPAFAYAQGLETADGWANLYPRVYREYWLRILAPLLRNVPAAKQIFDPESGNPQDHYIFLGADLMHPSMGALPGEDASRALGEGFDVDQRFDLKLLRLLNVKYLLSVFPLKGHGLQRIHAPADLPTALYSRDWATGLRMPPSGPRGSRISEKLRNARSDFLAAARRKLRGKDVFVYELTDRFERFRLVHTVATENDGKAVLDRLSSMDIAALRSTAVLEAVDANAVRQRDRLADGRIELVGYEPDRIELKVSVSGDAYLVIANTWSPFWTSTVDGQNKSLIRTNHAQYGLPLGAGTHKITLAYRPPYAF